MFAIRESSSRLSLLEERSEVVVKNLPLKLTKNGIMHLFNRAGKVKRVYLKPKKRRGLPFPFQHALIIYDRVSEAKKAVTCFDGLKIGDDGPDLRVTIALTREEKLSMKKQREVQKQMMDEGLRSPGFSLSPSKLAKDTQEAVGESSAVGTIDGGGHGESEDIKADGQVYVVNPDGTSEVAYVPYEVDLWNMAMELKLLRCCCKCKKECNFRSGEAVSYCSSACQLADREEDSKEYGASGDCK